MRLVGTLLANLLALLLWPLRALLRLCFAPRVPPLVAATLEGQLRYHVPARRGLSRFVGRSSPLGLEQLRRLADKAAAAPRCAGLLLILEDAQGTHAQWAAVAEVLAGLQRAGKKVAVFSESLSQSAYAALCGADLLILPGSGDLQLLGVGAELTSAGAALQKLGVRPRFARREGFKTAPELFTDTEPSAAQRETLDRLLDLSYAALCQGLGRRGLSLEGARRAIDAGPYTGRTALASKLIDAAAFQDQAPRLLRDRAGVATKGDDVDGDSELPPLALLDRTSRLAPLRWRPLRRPKGLALVPLTGVIVSGRRNQLPSRGSLIASDAAAEALAAARRDRHSTAALLTIDSRGGSALASEIIWREVVRLAAEKPTLVYVDAIAASGGYLIACGAKRILAAPLAIVGSIGVFSGRFDLSALLTRLGVRQEFVGRGAHAGLSHTGPLDDGEWGAVEALADDAYAAFLQIVADARGKQVDEVRPLAQGKIYSGEEAKAVGLVDAVVSYREALQEARASGGLSEESPLTVFGDDGQAGLRSLLRLLSGAALRTLLRGALAPE